MISYYLHYTLMKNLVKVLDNEVHDFTHSQQKFPNIIETKLRREIIMDQKQGVIINTNIDVYKIHIELRAD